MKKIFASLLFVLIALPAFAQDLGQFTLDGEVKTGFLWVKNEKIGQDPFTEVKLRSLDDAGDGHGRIRMNFGYANKNVGIKGRIQWDDWQIERKSPDWPYLFGYFNAFEDQFTLSLGKLGSSPWGTGGPEMWKELESISEGSGGGGVRFEYKPAFIPEAYGKLNIGFVLNWFNGSLDNGINRDVSLLDILQETVFGIAYEHEYFLIRFEYRLDNELDVRPGSMSAGGDIEGDDLVYRVEERILKNYLPGFQIWALGSLEGVGAVNDAWIRAVNWLFLQYAPDWGTAQIRLGYNVVEGRSILHFKPSYYHNFFDKLITVGASFYIANDFGEKRTNKDAPYTDMQIEPKLQINFTNAYVAFSYNFKQTYIAPQEKVNPPIERFQNMNLRFGMTF